MNSKGQVVILGLMLAIAAIVLIMALVSPIHEATTNARAYMNCSLPVSDTPWDNISIAQATQAACQSTDITLPLIIGAMLAVAGVALLGRIIFS